MSNYEEIRLKNIEDNKRVLRELGLLNPFKPLPSVVHRTAAQKRKRESDAYKFPKKAAKAFSEELDETKGSLFTPGQRRRSSRIQGVAAASPADIDTVVQKELADEDDDDCRRTPRVTPNRPKFYGVVPGVEVGTWWEQRIACSAAGIHRPTVAGIHGGEEGCYSLALSGGYEDDIDMGECFTYTGEGGRDLKGTKANPKNLRTAAQSKDQTLTRGNLALSLNAENGNPVRVIRGYKSRSPFAPEEGYRYDGLYTVEKYWYTVGMSGFGVYKFALRRVENQAPPPWDLVDSPSSPSSQDSGVGSDAGTSNHEQDIDDDLEKGRNLKVMKEDHMMKTEDNHETPSEDTLESKSLDNHKTVPKDDIDSKAQDDIALSKDGETEDMGDDEKSDGDVQKSVDVIEFKAEIELQKKSGEEVMSEEDLDMASKDVQKKTVDDLKKKSAKDLEKKSMKDLEKKSMKDLMMKSKDELQKKSKDKPQTVKKSAKDLKKKSEDELQKKSKDKPQTATDDNKVDVPKKTEMKLFPMFIKKVQA